MRDHAKLLSVGDSSPDPSCHTRLGVDHLLRVRASVEVMERLDWRELAHGDALGGSLVMESRLREAGAQ